MPRRILVVTAHLDPTPERLCRALAERRRVAPGAPHRYRAAGIPAAADHGGVVEGRPTRGTSRRFRIDPVGRAHRLRPPLQLGTMRACLKAFLEQVMRPGNSLPVR